MLAINEIEQLLTPVIEDMGLSLWGCEYIPGKKSGVLRVYIDKLNQNVEIEDCARVSRQISALLDVAQVVTGPYVLEVSSPGLERPLLKQEHYQQSLGKEIKLRLYAPLHGQRNFIGRLITADKDRVCLHVINTEDVEKESIEKEKRLQTEQEKCADGHIKCLIKDIKKAKWVFRF